MKNLGFELRLAIGLALLKVVHFFFCRLIDIEDLIRYGRLTHDYNI